MCVCVCVCCWEGFQAAVTQSSQQRSVLQVIPNTPAWWKPFDLIIISERWSWALPCVHHQGHVISRAAIFYPSIIYRGQRVSRTLPSSLNLNSSIVSSAKLDIVRHLRSQSGVLQGKSEQAGSGFSMSPLLKMWRFEEKLGEKKSCCCVAETFFSETRDLTLVAPVQTGILIQFYPN